MLSYSISGADMQERALRQARALPAFVRGQEAAPTEQPTTSPMTPSPESSIDWGKGTIDGKLPLANIVQKIYAKYDRDIPVSLYSDLHEEWLFTQKMEETIKRGPLEEFLDKYVFWWRDEVPVPILGTRTLTEEERQKLKYISLDLFEASHLLKALHGNNPEAILAQGSPGQQKILSAALGPYLWLSKLLKIEIQKRGNYPELPTIGGTVGILTWGIAIGGGLALFTWLKKD